MSEPRVWTDILEIADDLAQWARRVEDKLTDMERMTLDNLLLRLDTFVDNLPGAIHAQIMHAHRARHEHEDIP